MLSLCLVGSTIISCPLSLRLFSAVFLVYYCLLCKRKDSNINFADKCFFIVMSLTTLEISTKILLRDLQNCPALLLCSNHSLRNTDLNEYTRFYEILLDLLIHLHGFSRILDYWSLSWDSDIHSWQFLIRQWFLNLLAIINYVPAELLISIFFPPNNISIVQQKQNDAKFKVRKDSLQRTNFWFILLQWQKPWLFCKLQPMTANQIHTSNFISSWPPLKLLINLLDIERNNDQGNI